MLAVTRKSKIKDLITEKKSVTVSELAVKFSVTEETIRRDLKMLEDEGFLTRTYGGAFIQDGVQNEINVSIRETAYVESKELIAQKCLELVNNGDSIFIDDSTTALFVAEAVQSMRITVLTNSLKVTNLLAGSENIRLITIGGIYSTSSMSFLGRSTLNALDNFFVDKAFISCRSLSINHGITDSNEQTGEIRQRIIQRSNKVYLVADYSKFNKTSFISICGFEELSGIITDKPLDSEWRNFLSAQEVAVY
ncbi:DeoR/GlpR family DNA-binding transcription regulator [Oscillospiraceae bacterium PP1C4]